MNTNRFSSDVVVVGCGIAGLSAAVSALQAGRTVNILERAPEEDYGGNSRWTGAALRMNSDSEVSDDFEEFFARNATLNLDPNIIAEVSGEYDTWPAYVKSHPFADPGLISQFATQVPPTIAWLKSFGLRFAKQSSYKFTQDTSRVYPDGGGLAIIERLAAEAKSLGAKTFYRTTAIAFLRDNSIRISGVAAVGPHGEWCEFPAISTILASGGFQGNSEMLFQYIGQRARNIRPVARGGYYAKGEGIRMALAAGAAPAGEFGSYHAEPLDPRSRQPDPVVFVYPYGVLLDMKGQRFLDEAPASVSASSDYISRTIADQINGIAFAIFDAQVEEIPRWRTCIRSDIPPVEAPTLSELFEKLGIAVESALATIEAFNAACPKAGEFTPFQLDGLATTGLAIRKSNHARPITKAPFRAFPIISGICFTFGGLKVNSNAQVLDQDAKVIAGLYAAGETVGLYQRAYTGSTSVLRSAVFGRLAGLHAATVNRFAEAPGASWTNRTQNKPSGSGA
jgi:tricarballylate dehydrogenase